MPRSTAERIAEDFLAWVSAPTAPCALELATLAGLKPAAADVDRTSLTADGTLYYSSARRHTTQQRAIARALARYLLRMAGVHVLQDVIADTAAALLLPRSGFLRASERTGWDVRALQALYPNASFAIIATRIAMLHESVVTWFEGSKVRWRSPSCDELKEPTRFERHLAEIARETDTVLHPQDRVWAFPLRKSLGVVLVCETEALLARRS